jgi:hypothetical protein
MKSFGSFLTGFSRFTLLTCIGILVSQCKKDSPTNNPSVNFGYNYYPDEIGRYVVYEVDSIAYDDKIHPPDTFRYLLKELITEKFPDNTGRPTLRLERFHKIYNDTVPYDSMQWLGPRIWTANKTVTTLERKEENIIYLRLIFPVQKGKTWNGNAYNTLGEKEYEIISAHEPGYLNNLYFDSVTTVKQYENVNLIETKYEIEKYAANVGLIYKHITSIYHEGDSINNKFGYRFTQKIVGYGKQ